MRNTKTLLLMLREDFKALGRPEIGLCSRVYYLECKGKINGKECNKLFNILDSHRPKNADKYSPWWFAEDGIERGKFLDKLIKKYSKVNK